MAKHILSTVDELDLLDKQFSKKNHRSYANIQNRIGKFENVFFCFYEIYNGGFWGKQDLSEIGILTDTKLIYNNFAPNIFWDIKLTEITRVEPYNGSLFQREYGVCVSFHVKAYSVRNDDTITQDVITKIILRGNEDKQIQDQIASKIQYAIANQNNPSFGRIQSNEKQSNFLQNSISSQLEKLAELYKSGALSDDEFKRAKDKLLSR